MDDSESDLDLGSSLANAISNVAAVRESFNPKKRKSRKTRQQRVPGPSRTVARILPYFLPPASKPPRFRGDADLDLIRNHCDAGYGQGASSGQRLQQKASQKKSLDERSPYHHSSVTIELAHVQNFIIGSNSLATKAAFKKASEMGYVPVGVTNTLHGEAKKAAAIFSQLAKYIIWTFGSIPPDQRRRTFSETNAGGVENGLEEFWSRASRAHNSKSAVCIICGGETIVNVTGTDKGGAIWKCLLLWQLTIERLLKKTRMKF